jgi:hypothetical protein
LRGNHGADRYAVSLDKYAKSGFWPRKSYLEALEVKVRSDRISRTRGTTLVA